MRVCGGIRQGVGVLLVLSGVLIVFLCLPSLFSMFMPPFRFFSFTVFFRTFFFDLRRFLASLF